MAKEKVDISCDADTARAIEKLVAVAREMNKLGDAAENIGKQGSRGAIEYASSMDGLIGKWTSLATFIDLSTAAIKKFFDTSKKIREEQVDSTRVIDIGMTAYRVAQGNLSEAGGLDAAGRITGVAQETKSSNQAAFAAATLLAQYKVGREQAEGGALRELLQLQDLAESQGTIDPGALSRGTLDALQRSGKPITGDSIRGFGAAAFGLSRKLKGFDDGEIGTTASVATYGRQAGMSLEETMAIVGALSQDYGEGAAGKRFKSLFKDSSFSPSESRQVAALRARAAGLLAGSGGDYSRALDIAGGSMADADTQAQSIYEASGFKPGAMDSESIRKRFLAARRNVFGIDPFGEAIASWQFGFQDWLGGPEYAINNMTGDWGAGPSDPKNARIREQALGRQEITVKLQTYDGRDIPAETSAEGLNQPSGGDAFRDFVQ